MKKINTNILLLFILIFLSSSECSDGPDANTIDVNAWSVNIPSDGGEFVFICENYPYWMIEKILVVEGEIEEMIYPQFQSCDDVCSYANEWLTITIPAESKNKLKVEMKPYTEGTSLGRGAEIEMKYNDARLTLSATQYSMNSPSFD